MRPSGTDVVIVGGGIAGVSTAYFLGKEGVKSVVVERDSLGSHASGFAYGGLSGLSAAGDHSSVAAVGAEGFRLHKQMAETLPEETGVNIEFRDRPSLSLAFSDEDAIAGRSQVSSQQHDRGYSVRWVDAVEARSIESRISPDARGAVYVEGTADVEPYRLVVAMAQAAETMGATIRHGRVTGLKRDGDRVDGVVLEGQVVPCRHVVLAMGPWSAEASDWLGVNVPVTPLKGQILRLRAPGPPYRCSVSWNGNYATTKLDGLVWAGTTEERVGFDETPTTEARDRIMASLLKMLPPLEDAELVRQTACLRPLSSDRLPVLGPVPNWNGVYFATGGGRQGIVLGPAMGRVMADLVTKGASSIPIDGLGLGRFGE